MSEMVERVALAICGDDNPANVLDIHRIRARLAIQVMLTPTEGMRFAAHKASREGSPYFATMWRAAIEEMLK